MTLENMFNYCNTLALLAWAILLLFPSAKLTDRLIHSLVPVLVFGPLYTWFLLTGGLEGPEGASFSSLEGLMLFFTAPKAVLAGWVHYLMFDLFIGAWEARDAKRNKITYWLVLPCQILTLFAGPIGLTLYVLLRAGLAQRYSLNELH